MTHLKCSCGYESWSWTVFDPNPIAADFTTSHEARGHQVHHAKTRQKAER
jgi:hypothetical protein